VCVHARACVCFLHRATVDKIGHVAQDSRHADMADDVFSTLDLDSDGCLSPHEVSFHECTSFSWVS